MFTEILAETGAQGTKCGGKDAARLDARLPRFVGLKVDAVKVLQRLKVAIVGAGSVGHNIGLHLARFAAVVWLVDRGRLKAESLLTHPITPDQIGRPKATSLGRAIKRINPRTRVFVFDGPVEDLPLAAFADADLVVLATDNLRAELEVGQRCLYLGKPLVHASLHGETMVVQCRVFSGRADGACPFCNYTQAELQALYRHTRFSCEGFAEGKAKPEDIQAPTLSTSWLCSLAADLAMVEITRLVLGLGASVENTTTELCGYTFRTIVSRLVRNPECKCEHTTYRQARLTRPLAGCTLRELTAAAGVRPAEGEGCLSFIMDRFSYAQLGTCGCAEERLLERFVVPGEGVGQCSVCGRAVMGNPFYLHRRVPVSVVEAVLDRPLRDLGAAMASWAVIRAEDRSVLLLDRAQSAGTRSWRHRK